MTRREVAKRLGKSVAAVRRLEGAHLHPRQDVRGIHHFDEDEVEALAERITSGEVSVWRELRPGWEFGTESAAESTCQHCSDFELEITLLRQQLERQRRAHASELDALRTEREREQSQNAAERRQLDRELRQLIATIEAS